MQACPHCGVEVESPRRRTSPQNRLWWRYMTILGRDLGYTSEQMHEVCKFKFLGREDISTGLIIPGSTASLDPERMSQLVDQVREWAHCSLNIYLPSPEERFEVAA